jgi:pyridoxine kinase
MAILSIQSWVAYGHVGNAAAIFPLQRLGFEVWGVHTVQFSNHTGYGAWRGSVFAAAEVAAVLDGIAERGVLHRAEAVLTGYLGTVELGEAMLGAVDRVKAANPAAIWCCDPVIGDVGRGVFVKPELPSFFRDRALSRADILTPNHFELELLTGRTVTSIDDALSAAEALRVVGPERVLITSLRREGAPAGSVEMLAVDGHGAWLVTAPRLDLHPNGAGDVVAALFLAHILRTGDTAAALAAAASAIHAVLTATVIADDGELALVAAQDALGAPLDLFVPVRVR